MSIRSTSDTGREGSGIASVISEIERSSKEYQRPQRERNGAPIVLMMLVCTQASSAQLGIPWSQVRTSMGQGGTCRQALISSDLKTKFQAPPYFLLGCSKQPVQIRRSGDVPLSLFSLFHDSWCTVWAKQDRKTTSQTSLSSSASLPMRPGAQTMRSVSLFLRRDHYLCLCLRIS